MITAIASPAARHRRLMSFRVLQGAGSPTDLCNFCSTPFNGPAVDTIGFGVDTCGRPGLCAAARRAPSRWKFNREDATVRQCPSHKGEPPVHTYRHLVLHGRALKGSHGVVYLQIVLSWPAWLDIICRVSPSPELLYHSPEALVSLVEQAESQTGCTHISKYYRDLGIKGS